MGLMGMQAPIWTFTLVFIWLFMVAGMIVMHVSIAKIYDPLVEFPVNLKKGFWEGFGFSRLQTCATDVMNASADALSYCAINCTDKASCISWSNESAASLAMPSPNVSTANITTANVTTATEKARIVAAFAKGLTLMDKVGNDKYLGVTDFKQVSSRTRTIRNQVSLIENPSSCTLQVPLYTSMWLSGEGLYELSEGISEEINEMSGGKAVDKFTDIAKNIKYLHALPWVLFAASGFFMAMWCMNGACCCCSNGSVLQTCVFGMPCSILWFVAFVLNLVFAAIGWAFTIVLMDQRLSGFEGEPTIGEVLGHIKDNFPLFWTVTKLNELEDGLYSFRAACTIFVVSSLLIGCYSCCFWSCRPYGKGGKKTGEDTAGTNSV